MNLFKSYWSSCKRGLYLSLVSLMVLSCGSESMVTSGISGTGIVYGTVTGFGSIFVNGVEYEIDTADFDVDGNTMDRSDPNLGLGIGMVVRLEATDNGDGTGIASSVFYDDSIEGPITSITPDASDTNIKRIIILDQTVIINSATTTFDDVTFENIAIDDVVEVSGFGSQGSDILATRIEKKDSLDSNDPLYSGSAEVEIHGTISGYDDVDTFNLGTTVVTTNSQTELDDITSITNGLVVEVKGIYQTSDGSILASEVEGEGDSDSDGDDGNDVSGSSGDISLHGVVTSYTGNNDLVVNGIAINTDNIATTVLDQIEVGLEVEVKGNLDNGVLTATEIEVRSGNAHFESLITAVNSTNNTLSVGFNGTLSVDLMVDSQSQLYDDINNQTVTLNDINTMLLAGVVEAIVDARLVGSEWKVTSLKIKDLDGHEIKGIVTAKTPTSSLTINGLALDTSTIPVQNYQIADVDKTAAEFFAAVSVDSTIVEIEDEDEDGQFDKAEID